MIHSKEIALIMIATISMSGLLYAFMQDSMPVDREFELDIQTAKVNHESTIVVVRGQIINTGDYRINKIVMSWNGDSDFVNQTSFDFQNIGPYGTRDLDFRFTTDEEYGVLGFEATYNDGATSIQSHVIDQE